jgi:hypothetical protein
LKGKRSKRQNGRAAERRGNSGGEGQESYSKEGNLKG